MRKQVRYALAEIVRPTPHWAQRAQASTVEHLQRVQTRINGFGSFEVHHGRQHTFGHAATDFVRRANYAQLMVRFALEAEQNTQLGQRHSLRETQLERTRELDRHTVDVAEHRTRWKWRLRIRADVDRKQSAGKAAFSGARQVYLSLVASFKKASAAGALATCDQRASVRSLLIQQLRDDVVVAIEDLDISRHQRYPCRSGPTRSMRIRTSTRRSRCIAERYSSQSGCSPATRR